MAIIHWSDCAIYNGPAYPAGPCDCGALDLADDVFHLPVVPLVARSGCQRSLVENNGTSRLIEPQQLPSHRLVADTPAPNLPNPHDGMVGGAGPNGVEKTNG